MTMAKRHQTAKTKSDKKGRPKAEPAIVKELSDDLVGLAQLPGGPITVAGDGTIQAQAVWLSDRQLQGAQRRALAAQIGRVQGNRHLQQVVTSVQSSNRSGSRREIIVGETFQHAAAGGVGSNESVSAVGQVRAVQLAHRPGVLPSWSKRQLGRIQRQLRRLGLYRLKIDRKFGPGTKSGLVEAFGGDEWRSMRPNEILARIKKAKPPKGERGKYRLRYGEMFKDGVLDMVLGIGFDEKGAHKKKLASFKKVLEEKSRNFREDRAAAVRIYKQAGRVLGPSAFGMFFVRENALTYSPPVGRPRQIHAVVRLIVSEKGDQGAEAASAFREGMVRSDVTYYSGHGRYGSGPDFDRNMRYELFDKNGAVKTLYSYYELAGVLGEEGQKQKPKRSAWKQFKWRVRHKRIKVIGSNEGNVFLNPKNRHAGEFGAKLMYWNLKRKGGKGASPVTGRRGKLANVAKAYPERKYRLWVFDGCRTQDYVKSIRSTPRYGSRSTDILATRRTTFPSDAAATLASFLDSVLAQQSAEEISKGMDAQKKKAAGTVTYRRFGFEDNPVNR